MSFFPINNKSIEHLSENIILEDVSNNISNDTQVYSHVKPSFTRKVFNFLFNNTQQQDSPEIKPEYRVKHSSQSHFEEIEVIVNTPEVKPTKVITLFRRTKLPREGWIQSCFLCYTYTSDTRGIKHVEYKKYFYDYQVHLCDGCHRSLKNDFLLNREFYIMINEYINEYLIAP